jgi:DNA-binding GntR family transcriptional regulator
MIDAAVVTAPKTLAPEQAIGPVSVTEYLRAEIERRIIDGTLAPGAPLREEAIAREFGTSRSPIREAFKLLEGAGLLTQRPRRGVVVTEFSLRDIWEVYSLQKALYNLGLELAEPKLAEANIESLGSLVAGMEDALASPTPDIAKYQDFNRQFHRLPMEWSGHGRLLEISTALDTQVKRYSAHSLGTDPKHLSRSMDAHREIYAAIRARDITRAQQLVAAHVDQALEVLERRLRNGEDKAINRTLSGLVTPLRP